MISPPPRRRGPDYVTAAVVAWVLLSLLACQGSPGKIHAPEIRGLDALAARVERIAHEREQIFVFVAARACDDACLAGVESIRVEPQALACRCRRPSVGVHRVQGEP